MSIQSVRTRVGKYELGRTLGEGTRPESRNGELVLNFHSRQ
jgi:hypothetical protein